MAGPSFLGPVVLPSSMLALASAGGIRGKDDVKSF